MYYKEISNGIFVSNEHTVHYKLEVCPYCGATDTLSHHKYTERCIECGKAFNLYSVRRNKRCKGGLTKKTAEAHMALLVDMQRRRNAGYKVPSTFDEEFEATKAALATFEWLDDNVQRYPTTCGYCGAAMMARYGVAGVVRCKECEAKYQRYKFLGQSIDSLDQDGCDELSDIIKSYIKSSNEGYKVPHINRYIKRLNRRREDIGAGRKIFYMKDDE